MLLYYITDRQQFPGSERKKCERLLGCIGEAAAAGVEWIQLREKDLAPRDLEHLASLAKSAIAGTETKLLVSSRVDVAIACGLDGVHLTSSPCELPASEARVLLAKAGFNKPLVGVSCHDTRETALAEAHGADFAVFGPVFEKDRERRSHGIEALKDACRRSEAGPHSMNILALGGITEENATACISVGAAGVAGIRLFQQSTDLRQLVGRLRSLKPLSTPTAR